MNSNKFVFYRVDGYGDQFCFMDGGTDPQPVFACSKVLKKNLFSANAPIGIVLLFIYLFTLL